MNIIAFCLIVYLVKPCSNVMPFDKAKNPFVKTVLRGYSYVICPFIECCNQYGITGDMIKLKRLFAEDVFGQHIATDVIHKQVLAHWENTNPSKPLVISFHGWTGGGKNHVATLVASSLFSKGMASAFVHHFMATVHFPHETEAKEYANKLRDHVKKAVSSCPYSLFIFDEVDKFPPGVLDGIQAYMDFNELVDDVDYRNSIFILLSNTGGNAITNITYNMWLRPEKGKREDLGYQDFEELISEGAFNEKGGLYRSNIIEKSLIDLYVPFLPLERRHVRQCTEKEFKKQGHIPDAKDVEAIVNQLSYFPKKENLYSTSGCKRISQKVSYFLTDIRLKTVNHEL